MLVQRGPDHGCRGLLIGIHGVCRRLQAGRFPGERTVGGRDAFLYGQDSRPRCRGKRIVVGAGHGVKQQRAGIVAGDPDGQEGLGICHTAAHPRCKVLCLCSVQLLQDHPFHRGGGAFDLLHPALVAGFIGILLPAAAPVGKQLPIVPRPMARQQGAQQRVFPQLQAQRFRAVFIPVQRFQLVCPAVPALQALEAMEHLVDQLGDQHGQAQLPLHPPGGNGLTLIGNGGIGAEAIRFFNIPAVKKTPFLIKQREFQRRKARPDPGQIQPADGLLRAPVKQLQFHRGSLPQMMPAFFLILPRRSARCKRAAP